MERAADWIIDWIAKHHLSLYAVALAAIVVAVQTADFKEQVAESEARRAEAAEYAASHKIRVVLEGNPTEVANLAGQIAAVVR
jgi:hypothetical protein